MPEEGINYAPKDSLLSYEEMERLVKILYQEGFRKVRITGGEPFLRKDLLRFLDKIAQLPDLKIHITTNGTLIRPYLPQLLDLGIHHVNFSIDALSSQKFNQITRRNAFDEVYATLMEMIQLQFIVKTNTVVMAGVNEEEILPISRLAIDYDIEVRFLEEMPFNGTGMELDHPWINHEYIYQLLHDTYDGLTPVLGNEPSIVANTYTAPQLKGRLGIIASYSRTFCGTCNRLRITPQGQLKTCLYDEGYLNIRDLIRHGANDEQLLQSIRDAISHKAIDGITAESQRTAFHPVSESMATIGG